MSVVLITGCSSGFGLETALAFARRGDTTFATMRDLDRAEALSQRARTEDLRIELLALDVNDDASVAAAVREVEDRHGAIDVLVNNAGVDFQGSVETIDFDKARAVIETNFWGPVRTIRAALPAMRAKGGGVIINVSSASGRMPGTPYGSWYSASKHALNALTEAMFLELDGLPVRIVSIEPGFFRTEIVRHASDQKDAAMGDPYAADQAWLSGFFEKSVVDGGGNPEDVAEAIVQAADDPATPVHTLVGDDAQMLIDLYQQAGTIEAWLPVAVSFAESVAGPRPLRSQTD
jgi:NAD(P)-dependent dehydrogenase (short-subunit alcohol dehydrogenase family)